MTGVFEALHSEKDVWEYSMRWQFALRPYCHLLVILREAVIFSERTVGTAMTLIEI